MDYTANHHLPQWEKSDRIMMDDFNQMCRDIEAGLNQVQASSDSGLSTVNSDLARIHAIAADLARDTYRRAIVQRIAHNVTSQLDCLWYNGLYSREDAGESQALWTGAHGLRLGGTPATLAGIQASASEISFICNIPTSSIKSQTAAVQFTSDGVSILQSVGIYVEHVSTQTTGSFPITIYLRRADNGALVAQSAPLTAEGSPTGYTYYYTREVNFLLSPGVTYRMEFFLPDSAKSYFNQLTGFILANRRNNNGGTALVLAPPPSTATVTKSVTPPDWATAATFLSHWAGDGSVTLSVNGEALAASRTRSALNAQGAACQETEYDLGQLPEGPLELAASMQRGAGALHLYDYGVIWR